MITKKDFKKNVKFSVNIPFHKDFRKAFNDEDIDYIVLSYTTNKKLKIVTNESSYSYPIENIQDDGFWIIVKDEKLKTSWNIKFKNLNKIKNDNK